VWRRSWKRISRTPARERRLEPLEQQRSVERPPGMGVAEHQVLVLPAVRGAQRFSIAWKQ